MEDVFPPDPVSSKASQDASGSQTSLYEGPIKVSFSRFTIDKFMSLIDLELA